VNVLWVPPSPREGRTHCWLLLCPCSHQLGPLAAGGVLCRDSPPWLAGAVAGGLGAHRAPHAPCCGTLSALLHRAGRFEAGKFAAGTKYSSAQSMKGPGGGLCCNVLGIIK